MNNLQHIIQQLLDESINFNRKDVLVHIDSTDRNLIFAPQSPKTELTPTINRILTQTKENQKSAGFNSLCWAKGMAKFNLKGKETHSPLFLFPTDFTQNRLTKYVYFERYEVGIVNPFLIEVFKKELSISLPSNEVTWNEIENFASQIPQTNLTIDLNFDCIGNFHHHRYSTLRELEDLTKKKHFSPPLAEILGEKTSDSFSLNWSNNFLLPADSDHRKVLLSAQQKNLVVQGPPGTGKSQVLVNLIGKTIEQSQKIALVSEKFSALEVVQKRLKQVNLADFSCITTKRTDRKKFLIELKEVWEKLSNTPEKTPQPLLRLSEQLTDQLDFSIELLRKKDIVGGVSIRTFQEQVGKLNIHNEFVPWTPKISDFLQHETAIQTIYDKDLTILGKIQPEIVKTKQLLDLPNTLEKIQSLIEELQPFFSFSTLSELRWTTKQSVDLQLFESNTFNKYSEIFRLNSKENKRYLRLKRKWKSVTEQLDTNCNDWKIKPNSAECDSLLKQLSKGTFFQKRSAKKRWKQISNLDFSFAEERLINWKKQIDLIQQKTKLIQQLSEINIQHPPEDFSVIDASIPFFTEEKFKLFDAIPISEKNKIGRSHQQLSTLKSLLKSNFLFNENDVFPTEIKEIKQKISEITSIQHLLKDWSPEIFKIVSKIKSFEKCREVIFHSNWTLFSNQFPQFSVKNNEDLSILLTEILHLEKTEQTDFAQSIRFQIQEKFNEYSELLSTPARKLSKEKKELKKRLRKGKSILVKEFNKTRNHPSIRSLFSSEAREWIQLLKPIWLCNPSQISDSFPLEKGLFDVVLFDEASQMTLQDALGSIQRAKRIVICGDEQQMQPTHYFSQESTATDLLHHASFYLENIPLTHHYRSQTPDLIAFSNQYFYKNQLKVFPSSENKTGIEWKKVEGIYSEGKNEIEGKKVAELISSKITSAKSLGIVAFSEKQLECIWNNISSSVQEKLAEKIEQNNAFFKTLENVQGDECDEIIISFGYGQDHEGNFALRFGPMNLETGRNRLNVLLTRARKKIIFFSSVTAKDFKISNNESVETLRKWFIHLAQKNSFSETQKIDLTPEKLASSRDLITYFSILKERDLLKHEKTVNSSSSLTHSSLSE